MIHSVQLAVQVTRAVERLLPVCPPGSRWRCCGADQAPSPRSRSRCPAAPPLSEPASQSRREALPEPRPSTDRHRAAEGETPGRGLKPITQKLTLSGNQSAHHPATRSQPGGDGFAMPGLPVKQPQLIRSNQKDEYYLSSLRSYANEAFQIFAGAKRWLEWRKEIELLADLTYFSLTTFAGYQTLGEEYVNIVQVDSSGQRVPSPARRAALIILHTCIPYLLDRGLNRLEQDLQTENEGFRAVEHRQVVVRPGLSNWLQGAVSSLTAQQRKVLLQAVCVFRQAISFLHRLHLGIFYLNGAFYHIAKRFTGITYLCVRGLFSDSVGLRWSYELLGKVSLLQLALTVAMQINSYRQRQRARQEWKLHRSLPCSKNSSQDLSVRSSRCILCLEERRHSTATPCGHLFCWECITEWCNTKAECPLCRETFQPHRLIYLRHYI